MTKMNDDSYQLYSYNLYTKFLFYLFSIILAFLNLLLVRQLVLQIEIWFSSGTMNSTTIVGIVIVLLILGFSFVLCSNAYPNIRVYDKGLKVQVFLFWWVFVPWTEIEGIWAVGLVRKSYPVAVRKLTPFHRIIGLGYGSLKPVFPIGWSMKRYEELIKTIRENIQPQ